MSLKFALWKVIEIMFLRTKQLLLISEIQTVIVGLTFAIELESNHLCCIGTNFSLVSCFCIKTTFHKYYFDMRSDFY